MFTSVYAAWSGSGNFVLLHTTGGQKRKFSALLTLIINCTRSRYKLLISKLMRRLSPPKIYRGAKLSFYVF